MTASRAWLPLAVLTLLARPAGAEPFTIETVAGPLAGTEHRFFHQGFHFATLIEDAAGRLIFRPHPDRADPNGFGTSVVLNPFLSGGEPGQGTLETLEATRSGIDVVLRGPVMAAGGATFGTWLLTGTLSYDAVSQRVSLPGALGIVLDGTLDQAGADLNLHRTASNFLHSVPLQTGSIGDTGDLRHVVVRYAPTGDVRDFIWDPVALPAHFPQDLSTYLEIEVVGELNTVDTEALGEGFQIAIARKPTVRLTYVSSEESMIAGLVWDASQGQAFEADNVGLNHIFPRVASTSTTFDLNFTLEATVIPEPRCAVGDDPDGDDVCASEGDNCAEIQNVDQTDMDSDGLGDACDYCRALPSLGIASGHTGSAGQTDDDGDGIGTACDGDFDGTGFVNVTDLLRFLDAFGKNTVDATCPDEEGHPTAGCARYDLDLQGSVINVADLLILIAPGLFGTATSEHGCSPDDTGVIRCPIQ